MSNRLPNQSARLEARDSEAKANEAKKPKRKRRKQSLKRMQGRNKGVAHIAY
ncbi:MAG: hypothetical protein FWG30_10930 [Eubacteriaceae bacterium]|nr:hypothetical protein [Eubacteriaceae bacterium]